MSLHTVVEAVTNPQVALPITGVGLLAQILEALPHVLVVGWIFYVLLLISH
jgi:hypothetical protein